MRTDEDTPESHESPKDAHDLDDLRRAVAVDDGDPGISIDELKSRLGI
jgi:hypothetical protein